MRAGFSDRRTSAYGYRRGAPPLRVGVVGAGAMGNHHARVYASIADVCQLNGVYDVVADRAAATAQRFETRAYETLDELLAHVDAVSIASPTSAHVEHAGRALEAGVDVLVEKPVAGDLHAARHLRALARRFPARVVQVGHIEHFNPAIDVLRKLLAAQPALALDIQRLSPFDGRITDADVVQDLMIHDVHVVLSLARSELRRVQAVTLSSRSESQDDYAAVHLVFGDGMIARLSASRITEEKIRRLTATTSDAHITLDYLHRSIQVCRWTRLEPDHDDDRAYRQESVVERIFVPQEEPLVAQLRSFVACVRGGGEPEVGIDMGVRCLEVVEQIRAAARNDDRLPVAA
jgi:predicted dehydrogenase